MSDEQFVDSLNHAFYDTSEAPFVGSIIPETLKSQKFERPPLVTKVSTRRFAFPLSLTYANDYVAHRMALVGDAAHRIHPMAGQGLNMGLTDVAYLANCIIKACNGGADFGNLEHVLGEYDHLSKTNALSVISSIEFVRNSYSPYFLGSERLGHLLSLARNFSTELIDSSDLLKHNFMSYASGNLTHPKKYLW